MDKKPICSTLIKLIRPTTRVTRHMHVNGQRKSECVSTCSKITIPFGRVVLGTVFQGKKKTGNNQVKSSLRGMIMFREARVESISRARNGVRHST